MHIVFTALVELRIWYIIKCLSSRRTQTIRITPERPRAYRSRITDVIKTKWTVANFGLAASNTNDSVVRVVYIERGKRTIYTFYESLRFLILRKLREKKNRNRREPEKSFGRKDCGFSLRSVFFREPNARRANTRPVEIKCHFNVAVTRRPNMACTSKGNIQGRSRTRRRHERLV